MGCAAALKALMRDIRAGSNGVFCRFCTWVCPKWSKKVCGWGFCKVCGSGNCHPSCQRLGGGGGTGKELRVESDAQPCKEGLCGTLSLSLKCSSGCK